MRVFGYTQSELHMLCLEKLYKDNSSKYPENVNHSFIVKKAALRTFWHIVMRKYWHGNLLTNHPCRMPIMRLIITCLMRLSITLFCRGTLRVQGTFNHGFFGHLLTIRKWWRARWWVKASWVILGYLSNIHTYFKGKKSWQKNHWLSKRTRTRADVFLSLPKNRN